jgi:hypothetical protein
VIELFSFVVAVPLLLSGQVFSQWILTGAHLVLSVLLVFAA